MHKPENILSLIQQQGILPLFYHDDLEVCTEVINLLYSAGIRAIEFTNRGAYALQNFRQLTALANQQWPALQLGIGTIINAQEADNFIEAGAAFIVSPGAISSVAQAAHNAGLQWIPGCLTPTEIITAKDNCAKLVKIFPGSLVGPAYITAIKEVFSDLLFMPTGGVDVSEASIGAWFKAGVCAVGLGSKMISKKALDDKDYSAISALAKEAMEIVKKVKGERWKGEW